MPTWPLEKVEEFGQFVSLCGCSGGGGGEVGHSEDSHVGAAQR